MSYEKVKISAYVMVPVEIEIDVTEQAPNDGRHWREWFKTQLENGVKVFTEDDIKIEDGFVDVTNFGVGDKNGGAYLSSYGSDQETFKRLAKIVQAKLELYNKIQITMRVTNHE